MRSPSQSILANALAAYRGNATTFTEVSTEGELSSMMDGSDFPRPVHFGTPEQRWAPRQLHSRRNVSGNPRTKREVQSLEPMTWVFRYLLSNPAHYPDPKPNTEILIHWGNDASDTEGCIVVGSRAAENFIGSSRKAFEMLWDLIQIPARSNDCSIEVIGGA